MQMPVLDGFAATSSLRSLGFTAPIIAVSGNALLSDIERFKQVGGNAFLTKVFPECYSRISFNILVSMLIECM